MTPRSTWNSDHPAVEKYGRHVSPEFIKLLGILGYGRVFRRAKDTRVWDHRGKEYLDFLAGFGSVNIGHNHPSLIDRLKRLFDEEPLNLAHTSPSIHTAELAEALAARTDNDLDVSLFSNSGAEAVEAGMKLARAATGRTGFLYCHGAYHGTNPGALSLMGDERMREPFEPLLDGCVALPFGDLAALKRAIEQTTPAAFIVEPIQCEGGIVLPPSGYLREARELCRRNGVLLIFDEVQTGLGRTGAMFAYQREDVDPDVLVLGKALGGSFCPISATITSQAISQKAYGALNRFGLHGSTFSGNAIACVAAMETLKIIDDEELVRKSALRGRRLLEGCRNVLAGHPFVRDIRGSGLLVGIELGPTDAGVVNAIAPQLVSLLSKNLFGHWMALKLLEKGIICQPAAIRWNVLKLEPPLTVTELEIDRCVAAIGEIFAAYRNIPALLSDVAGRLASQCVNGWSF